MEASKVTVASPALLVGLAFAVPFLVLNAIVATQLEPLFSLVRPGVHTGPFEYPLLAVMLLLVAAGAVVALLPRAAAGARRKPPVSGAQHPRRGAARGGIPRDRDRARRGDLPLRRSRAALLRLGTGN